MDTHRERVTSDVNKHTSLKIDQMEMANALNREVDNRNREADHDETIDKLEELQQSVAKMFSTVEKIAAGRVISDETDLRDVTRSLAFNEGTKRKDGAALVDDDATSMTTSTTVSTITIGSKKQAESHELRELKARHKDASERLRLYESNPPKDAMYVKPKREAQGPRPIKAEEKHYERKQSANKKKAIARTYSLRSGK